MLVDDLVTRGTSEPYRMFTSRAEYRLLLRQDNADLRLTSTGHALGLVDERRWRAFNRHREAIDQEQQRLQAHWVRPATATGEALSALLGKPLAREYRASDLLRRPEISYRALMAVEGIGPGVQDADVAGQVEIQAKYAGYLDRQQAEIERQQHYREQTLPVILDYIAVSGLSGEACEKLQDVRPQTIGQAARIPGITPAAVSLLLVHIKKLKTARRSA